MSQIPKRIEFAHGWASLMPNLWMWRRAPPLLVRIGTVARAKTYAMRCRTVGNGITNWIARPVTTVKTARLGAQKTPEQIGSGIASPALLESLELDSTCCILPYTAGMSN